MKRLEDGQATANWIKGLGSASLAGPFQHDESHAVYGLLQEASSYSDITNQAFLDALVQEELGFRRRPRELVYITPQTGVAPEPFTHIHLGDSFFVYVGERLRGGFAGIQRCYGFDISLSDEGIESVDQYVTSPE